MKEGRLSPPAIEQHQLVGPPCGGYAHGLTVIGSFNGSFSGERPAVLLTLCVNSVT